MPRFPRIPSYGAMLVAAAIASIPALAQQDAVSTRTADQTLGVATLKLEHGSRASKVIGSRVYDEQSQSIGSVDDLIMTRDDKVVVAIISVGGFLGIGSKLVAIPWNQLRFGDDGRLVLPGATRDALNAMPNFTYNG